MKKITFQHVKWLAPIATKCWRTTELYSHSIVPGGFDVTS